MPELNFHHLRLFHAVVQAGGVTAASRRLALTQPTISGQVRALEEALGVALFERSGRGLVLTEAGKAAFRYAEEIFALGQELSVAVRGEALPQPVLTVGISDTVPKIVAHRLLVPVLDLPEAPRLVCVEDRTERLLAALVLHEVDLVVADAPMHRGFRVKAHHHRLGASPLCWMAAPALAERLLPGFPASLQDAPVLLPTEHAAVRHRLDLWFEEQGLRPRVVGEFDDGALLKTFGESGAGAFPAPAAVAADVARTYGTVPLGTVPVVEELYAITVERRIRHPAVAAVTTAARRLLGPG